MVEQILEEQLQEVVHKFKEYDSKTYDKTEKFYLDTFLKEFADIDGDAIRYALMQFNKLELWKKNMAYFRAIVLRRAEEIDERINMEKRSLGGVPKNVA